MKKNVDISVIVASYNVGVDLERCLTSLVDKKFEDFEIIIMNDGSTDRGGKRTNLFADTSEKIFNK